MLKLICQYDYVTSVISSYHALHTLDTPVSRYDEALFNIFERNVETSSKERFKALMRSRGKDPAYGLSRQTFIEQSWNSGREESLDKTIGSLVHKKSQAWLEHRIKSFEKEFKPYWDDITMRSGKALVDATRYVTDELDLIYEVGSHITRNEIEAPVNAEIRLVEGVGDTFISKYTVRGLSLLAPIRSAYEVSFDRFSSAFIRESVVKEIFHAAGCIDEKALGNLGPIIRVHAKELVSQVIASRLPIKISYGYSIPESASDLECDAIELMCSRIDSLRQKGFKRWYAGCMCEIKKMIDHQNCPSLEDCFEVQPTSD